MNPSNSSVQFGGSNNGVPSGYGVGNVPDSIRAQPHQNADFDTPGVVGYQSKNLTTYGRTTAWRVPSGKTPAPFSKNTAGSYLNFD